jgi:predicted nucleotidyltransferase
MAAVSNEIIASARKFRQMLSALGLQVDRVILFGSYATGTAGAWSDIDIALVSKDFSGNGFYDRKKVNPALIKTDTRIEPHPFRPEDFTDENPFVKEILRQGVEL